MGGVLVLVSPLLAGRWRDTAGRAVLRVRGRGGPGRDATETEVEAEVETGPGAGAGEDEPETGAAEEGLMARAAASMGG